MTGKERLNEFVKYTSLSGREFSKKVGLSSSFLSKSGSIGSDKLMKIVDTFPELSLDWIIKGEGSMLRDEGEGLPKDYQMVPLVDTEVIGGYGSAAFNIEKENIIGYFPVSNYGLASVDFSVKIHGESMWPRYCGGDKVDCKIIQEEDYIQWNRIYVISTRNQGLLLKRVRKGSAEDKLLLVSDNPDFDSFEILLDEVYGMALVLGGQKVEW